jgi:hypothetical protein
MKAQVPYALPVFSPFTAFKTLTQALSGRALVQHGG